MVSINPLSVACVTNQFFGLGGQISVIIKPIILTDKSCYLFDVRKSFFLRKYRRSHIAKFFTVSSGFILLGSAKYVYQVRVSVDVNLVV